VLLDLHFEQLKSSGFGINSVEQFLQTHKFSFSVIFIHLSKNHLPYAIQNYLDFYLSCARLDLGALHREYVGIYAVNVWVLQKRNAGYTPERVRWDLTQMIDDVLLREMFDTFSDVKYEVLTGWSERDEPEDKLLRSEILVAIYYEKERMP
jgi:hypothetical protein